MSYILKVGVAQMCSGISPAQNLARVAELAQLAAEKGAQYLLTPEMSVAFGDGQGQFAQAYEGNETLETCARIARDNGLFLHIGSLAIAVEGPRLVNRSVLFDPKGQVLDFYDKIHLFDADVAGDDAYRESEHYRAGKRAVLSQVGDINLGMSICYDMRFGALYRHLAQAGAHMIAVPAAFTVPTGKAHWEILLRARAIETGCFVLAAAQGGQHENGRATYGHSMIIDPWGTIMLAKQDQTEGVIFAELDFDKVKQARGAVPALANGADFLDC